MTDLAAVEVGDDDTAVEVKSSFDYDRRAYYIMVLLGVGVLLPWNVILNTLNFLDDKFPDFDNYVTPAYVYPQLPLLALMVKVRVESF